jgi:transcription initiation factor TFIIF subunit beta
LFLGTTEFKGAIEHLLECQPRFDIDYQAHLKQRHDAAQPQGGIKFMEDMGATTSEIRRLNAGRGTKAAAGTGIGKPLNKSKKPQERMTRIAKNDLLDQLFLHFREQKYWSLKDIRQKVQQPEGFLKEVLGEIAVLEKSGPNNGTYRLTENYVAAEVDPDEDDDDDDDVVEMQVDIHSQQYSQLYKMEPSAPVFDYGAPDDEDEDDEDEDGDEEMESQMD